MEIASDITKPTPKTFRQRIKQRILFWLRITNQPVIRLYNGYGNNNKVFVFGHALKLSPLGRKKFKRNFFLNSYGLLRMFMVKPLINVTVNLYWEGRTFTTISEDDGFFKFEWELDTPLSPGWHSIQASFGDISTAVSGEFFIPYQYKFAFISDIDDTFLISHSSNLRKRLYVLLTKNARSRKPFEGVVNHYQLLASSGASTDTSNMFFYVSSSEWNLYDYIKEFALVNKLPKGIYLLNQMKKFSQVFKTGTNNHKTKFMRIARIIEAYPTQKFILLGDDSQEDPNIYSAVVEHFPQNIHAVFLRNVRQSNCVKVGETVNALTNKGVQCCYFKHSSEAVVYSRQAGLIVEK